MYGLLKDQMVLHQFSLKMLVPLSAILLLLFFSCSLMMAAFRQYGVKPLLQQFIKRVKAVFLLSKGQFH